MKYVLKMYSTSENKLEVHRSNIVNILDTYFQLSCPNKTKESEGKNNLSKNLTLQR